MKDEILSVGEVLWDILPGGKCLGGAPFNVACHLHALGAPVAFASRVGRDDLGREILDECRRRGMPADLVQEDPALPTGRGEVTFPEPQSPKFVFLTPCAWDAIEATPALLARARSARAILMGTLAQRDPRSRATVRALCALPAFRVFDVNLRPPFDDRAVVEACLYGAKLLKLNDGELARFRGWFGLPKDEREAAAALAARFGCETVCVTRGERGAALWRGGEWREHPGYRVKAADPVGAGDAFLAALLSRLLDGGDLAEALRHANATGAFVASRPGATPPLDAAAIGALLARDASA
jgi:fructokinase